ncbi:MAG: glycosyltransferase [Patescibacteria group bacterium]|nr:glycosyltransferase [Patescibacteria group bacterium]
MLKKIIITGGHATPALAVIEKIKSERSAPKIFYFGRKYVFDGSKKISFEYQQLTGQDQVSFITINAGRLPRQLNGYSIISLLKIPLGFFQSFCWLAKINPAVIVSFGGYLSTPVVIAGWFLGIPSISHEQTGSLGLANKINSFFSKKVAVSFPEVLDQIPAKKGVLTGNPIGREKFSPSRKEAIFKFISEAKKPILFITGGKSGSKTINLTVRQALPKLKKNFAIIHQVGVDDCPTPQERGRYLRVRFIEASYFDWLLFRSHLIVSRSGANIVLRLAFFKKRAVLIPIPNSSGDEQNKNAKFLKGLNLAVVLKQDRLNQESLIEAIRQAFLLKISPKYPPWWSEADPARAAGKIWRLAKEVAR